VTPDERGVDIAKNELSNNAHAMKRTRTSTGSAPRIPGSASALAVLATTLAFSAPAQPVLEASSNLTVWSGVGSITITNADGTASFTHTPADHEGRMFFRATPG